MSKAGLNLKNRKALAIKLVYVVVALAILAGLVLPMLATLGADPVIMAPGQDLTMPNRELS